jgi:DDE superfamily endonuclease
MIQLLLLLHKQVVWEDQKKGDQLHDCLVSVDCTDCPIQEPQPYDKKISKIWYTVKTNGPGLRYECAVCIHTGEVVWINGPFPCGAMNDWSIFRDGLRFWLDVGERVEADDGYLAGDPEYCKTKSGMSRQVENAKVQGATRARGETINKRLKQYAVLTVPFRHDIISKHSDCFRSCVVLTQLAIRNDQPLFDLDYDITNQYVFLFVFTSF